MHHVKHLPAAPEKPADTRYPIHELLRRRWSPRAFSDRPVQPDAVRSLLEAARWAASSRNEQPWRFTIATQDNPTEFRRLLSCLRERNIIWAQHAPVLMLSVAKLYFDRDGKLNRHAFHDVGLAVQNMIIQATALGLSARQMGGFYVDKARQTFNIPEDYEPVAVIALGYAGDVKILPEDLRRRELQPRARYELESLVFTGTWEHTSPLLSGDKSQ